MSFTSSRTAVLETAFRNDRVTADDLLATRGDVAPWFAGVTYGGPDRNTGYIGGLRRDRIPDFHCPVAGLPKTRWNDLRKQGIGDN